MAYYLAVETSKNNIVATNIKRCVNYFEANYLYEEPGACSLQEINRITVKYKDEQELKEALIKSYVFKEEWIDKPLTIFYAQDLEQRLVRGKVLYEDSRNMLDNPSLVIDYIETKSKENDYLFFRQLSLILPDDSIGKMLVCKIASLLEEGLISNKRNQELDETNSVGKNLVTETAKLLIHYNQIYDNGMIASGGKINYENLHNVISFISDYEKYLKNSKDSDLKRVKTNKNTSE